MNKPKIIFLVFFGLFLLIFSFAHARSLGKWFSFDRQNSLSEWEEKVFKGRVLYKVESKRAESYLSAYSKNASSGIVYRINFHPKAQPLMSWKWKVEKFPEKQKAAQDKGGWIEKDDYAARVYVIFPSLFFAMTKSLEYVWDKNLPEGRIITSPYFGNIKIIVSESGANNLGKWVEENRNIYEDYKKAFGREPGKVGAIAIMTDTDDTVSTAEANYDEIKVGYKNGEK
ncbi:MAG: DUF3047 domain-containing protein [Candidatus Omnitrophota bacterium]